MTTFKALLVGAGGMGKAWGNNLDEHPDVELTGWVDLRPGAAAEAADELKLFVPHTGTDLGKALAETKPDFCGGCDYPGSASGRDPASTGGGRSRPGRKADGEQHGTGAGNGRRVRKIQQTLYGQPEPPL